VYATVRVTVVGTCDQDAVANVSRRAAVANADRRLTNLLAY
jgi:hypothetical protein